MRSGSTEKKRTFDSARAVEHERRRIARGLHDRIGHLLLDALAELEQLDDPRTATARRKIHDALESTRSLTFDLGLPPVGEFGLGGILETLSRSTDAGQDLKVFYNEKGDAAELPDGVVLVLSQIVRELLFNVVKHARATTASVSLEYQVDRIRITVTDNGQGLAGEVNGDGFGLADANQRLRELGGRFEFGTWDGHGTRVVLELPVGDPGAAC